MLTHLKRQVTCILLPAASAVEEDATTNDQDDLINFDMVNDDATRREREVRRASQFPSNAACSTWSESNSPEVEQEAVTKRRKKTIRFAPETDDRFYCPYKRCEFLGANQLESMYEHIRLYHDYRFPQYDPESASIQFCTPSNAKVDLTVLSNKLLEPGQRLRSALCTNTSTKVAGRILCPYISCMWDAQTRNCIIPHLRQSHLLPLPKFRKKEQYFLFSKDGDTIEFSDDPKSKILEDGGPIHVVTANDKEGFQSRNAIILTPSNPIPLREEGKLTGRRYYCPYIGCPCTKNERARIFQHIRGKHDCTFPIIQAHRKYTFKDSKGEPVSLDGTSRLTKGEKMTLEYDHTESKIRYFCPFEGCTTSSKFRRYVIWHIRDEHDPQLPDIAIIRQPFTLCTSSGRKLSFSYEEQQTPVRNGERLSIAFENSDQDRTYCPYQGCNQSFPLSSRLYDHLRRKHDTNFPYVQSHRPRMVMSLSGEMIDLTNNPKRRLLDSDECLTIVYQNEENHQGSCYLCPYYGCHMRNPVRARVYSHIREIHDQEFPRFERHRGSYHSRSMLTGRKIEYDEQFMRKGDKIEIVYEGEDDEQIEDL